MNRVIMIMSIAQAKDYGIGPCRRLNQWTREARIKTTASRTEAECYLLDNWTTPDWFILYSHRFQKLDNRELRQELALDALRPIDAGSSPDYAYAKCRRQSNCIPRGIRVRGDGSIDFDTVEGYIAALKLASGTDYGPKGRKPLMSAIARAILCASEYDAAVAAGQLPVHPVTQLRAVERDSPTDVEGLFKHFARCGIRYGHLSSGMREWARQYHGSETAPSAASKAAQTATKSAQVEAPTTAGGPDGSGASPDAPDGQPPAEDVEMSPTGTSSGPAK